MRRYEISFLYLFCLGLRQQAFGHFDVAGELCQWKNFNELEMMVIIMVQLFPSLLLSEVFPWVRGIYHQPIPGANVFLSI